MCAKHNMVLQPSKVRILFNEVDFYGWKLDVNGRSPSERNVSPFRRMVPPKSMDDLRHVVGLFNCFRQFLVSYHEDSKTSVVRPHYYSELIDPISVATMTKLTTNLSFEAAWGAPQQR